MLLNSREGRGKMAGEWCLEIAAACHASYNPTWCRLSKKHVSTLGNPTPEYHFFIYIFKFPPMIYLLGK